jgi:CRP/FNR family transcriptional regulator
MDSERLVAELRKADLFQAMGPADLSAVAALAEERVSPPGQHFFFEGDIATEFFLVCSGKVRVYVPGHGDELEVGIVSAGELFGEGGMLDGGPRVASAVALEPSTVLAIPRPGWLDILQQRNELCEQMLIAVGASFRRYAAHAIDLLFLDVAIPDFPPDDGHSLA